MNEKDISRESYVTDTYCGKVRGYKTKNGVISFKGIPYAEPPVKELRFSPPVPKKNWENILDAKRFGPVAPQPVEISSTEILEQSEEQCLNLNIWTPALDDKERTVMVWIHGGAFETGSGRFMGEVLAKHGDVVIASINYRLGTLGFLYVPGKTANVGLLDQVLALKWLKNNINYFGGDEKNICVFGESAGGESISALLAIPSAKGLFKRAIIQSCVCDPYNLKPREGEIYSKKVFENVGVNYPDLGTLREVPAEDLVKAYSKSRIGLSHLPAYIDYYPPYIDGEVLPYNPFEAMKSGFAKEVEILAGTNQNEQTLWNLMNQNSDKITEEQVNQNFHKFLKYLNQDDLKIKEFIKVYEHNGINEISTKERDMMDEFYTDVMFRIPVMRFLEIQSKIQPNVFLYLFKWKSPWLNGRLGAYHALDVAFVWGTLSDIEGLFITKRTPETTKISNQMMDYWICFAKTGNPNHQGALHWPKYNVKDRSTMIFNKISEVINDPFSETRKIWDNVI